VHEDDVVANTSKTQPAGHPQRIFGSTLGNPDEFLSLLEWCSDGRLLPPIDARYPLDRVCAAFSHLESGAQFGKIAIDI